MKITINKFNALDFLEAHKARHIVEFEKQLKGWQAEMEDYSIKMRNWANAGGFSKDKPEMPPKPENFVREYDKYIEMLEHHILDKIALNEDDYRHIVKDKFTWKDYFLTNSARYNVED